MRVFKGLLATVLLAGSFAANAVPMVWTDYRDFNPDIKIRNGGLLSLLPRHYGRFQRLQPVPGHPDGIRAAP